MTIKRIYCDLDGCLCDMEKRYTDMYEMTPKQARNELSSKEFRKYWKFFVETSQFATLDKHPTCDELVKYLTSLPKDVVVATLTSSAGFEYHEMIQRHKLQWLKDNKIPFAPVIVPGKRYKKGYADANSFLIDDHPQNVYEFIQAGGHGVIHVSAEETIAAVERFLNGT